MKQKTARREFNLHEAYQGFDGRWYTIERDPYQLFAKYDYAENDLRGKGCVGNGAI